MMLIHCHPSGNVSPSKADTMMTDRMNKLCELMGIPLIDHIICLLYTSYVVNDNYINISVDTDTAFETDGDTNDAIITVEYSDAPAVGELTDVYKRQVFVS